MSEILDYTKVKTADFADKIFNCSCGRQHIVKTKKIYLGENALAMLSSTAQSIIPAGKVLFITCEDILSPYGNNIENELKSLGYDVIKYVFPKNTKSDIKYCGELLKLPEDIRLAVSFGSGSVTDMAKYYCSISGVNLICITSAPSMDAYLSDISSLYINGVKETIKSAAPYAVLCDLKIMRKAPYNMIAAGFGDICAKITSLCDWYFAKCIAGEYFCDNIYNMANQCIDMCLNAGNGLINRSDAGIDILCEALLRSSLCMQLSGGSRCASGGEHHLAYIIEMMRIKEGRETALHGEMAFLSLKYILNLYLLFFNKKYTDLLFPVDKPLHAEMLAKFTNMNYFNALSKMDYDLSIDTQKLRGYKVEEYRLDFINSLQKAAIKADTASVIFKRIYTDSGFWINGYINDKELKIGVALAADIRDKFTILAHMRNLGIFERYLS